jgi:DNA-binding transcriptional regulator YhcF (GntR family)
MLNDLLLSTTSFKLRLCTGVVIFGHLLQATALFNLSACPCEHLGAMSSGIFPSSTIERLAAQLEGDIRQKGLRPGDRYLTAAEASHLFEVAPMTMHRAMQTLAEREILVRQRSRGTFVGPKFHPSGQMRHELDVLHLVMAMDYHRTQSFSSDVLVDEFNKSLSGVTVQVHHILDGAAKRYIDQIIERIGGSTREGFVLIRCSRDIQLRVSESGLPAAVFGQAYPGVNLPCVEHDQVAVGRMIAEYALQQGAKRFAILTHALWRFGDHAMIDSATATLSAAGVQLDSLKIRSLPAEREVVEESLQEILADNDPPDGFLCRSDFYANIVCEELGGCRRLPCVVSGSHAPPNGPLPFGRVCSSMSLPQQVEHVAKVLTAASRGEHDKIESILIPVHFQYPE